MRREERRQLETDALILRIERATDWARDNRRTVLTGVLALVGASLLIGGLLVQRSARREAAETRLARLTADLAAAADGEVGQRGPCQTSLAGLIELADDRGNSLEGRTARYYAGVCQRALGDLDAAAASFSEVRGRGDLLDSLATMDFAGVRRRSGAGGEAAAAYRSLLDRRSGDLPLDPVLFELAVLEEEEGRPAAAAALYERIAAEFPASPYRSLADDRRARLPAEPPDREAEGEAGASGDASSDRGSTAGGAGETGDGAAPGAGETGNPDASP